jgi:bacterioferritin-associated ferredoxin
MFCKPNAQRYRSTLVRAHASKAHFHDDFTFDVGSTCRTPGRLSRRLGLGGQSAILTMQFQNKILLSRVCLADFKAALPERSPCSNCVRLTAKHVLAEHRRNIGGTSSRVCNTRELTRIWHEKGRTRAALLQKLTRL